MPAPAHHVRYSREEYLALEEASNVRHEFLDGQIYGMPGGTPEHAALATALGGIIFGQVRGGPCRSYASDLRVRVAETGLVTYPDLTVVCGPIERDTQDSNAVANPTLLVEVLSPSTEGSDRGDKFEHYKRLASLEQYVLLAPAERRVEIWTRGDEGWSSAMILEGAVVLESINVTTTVAEIYDAAAPPA